MMRYKIRNVLMCFSLTFSWLIGFLFVVYCAVVSTIKYPLSADNIAWILLSVLVIAGTIIAIKDIKHISYTEN